MKVAWSSTAISTTTQPDACARAWPWEVTIPSAAPATYQIIPQVFVVAILQGWLFIS
jgi:hypothetical protein